jgi:hypothetical protein
MAFWYNLWPFGITYGHLEQLVAIWYNLCPFGIHNVCLFGITYGHFVYICKLCLFGIIDCYLVYFAAIWYIFPFLNAAPRKIWQACFWSIFCVLPFAVLTVSAIMYCAVCT